MILESCDSNDISTEHPQLFAVNRMINDFISIIIVFELKA
jgi:hypothetical protein